jgi:cullin-associated NEDD8-dissociated protein 1
MCYDPNYQYSDENEEEDMEIEEEDEGGMYDGDDDKSWKVRKAAVKLVSAIINSRSDCITNL